MSITKTMWHLGRLNKNLNCFGKKMINPLGRSRPSLWCCWEEKEIKSRALCIFPSCALQCGETKGPFLVIIFLMEKKSMMSPHLFRRHNTFCLKKTDWVLYYALCYSGGSQLTIYIYWRVFSIRIPVRGWVAFNEYYLVSRVAFNEAGARVPGSVFRAGAPFLSTAPIMSPWQVTPGLRGQGWVIPALWLVRICPI